MKKKIKLQEFYPVSGEKTQGYLPIQGTNIELPVTFISGVKKGKTVLITGGIHNAEYVGIQTAMELAAEIMPEEISGNVIIIPLVNRSGFEHRTRSVVWEDGKNLNKEFPGKEDGSYGERICAFIASQAFPRADYYIDLHCGDDYEELIPHVYHQGVGSDKVMKLSKKMAKAVNVRYAVKLGTATASACNCAGSQGIAGILLERGCGGTWSAVEVQEMKQDIYRVLNMLNITATVIADEKVKTHNIIEPFYESAPEAGCWYPQYQVGEQIEKGAILGVIKDYFGNVRAQCICQADATAVVLYQASTLCISKGEPLIAYGRIKQEEGNCE